LYDQDVTQWTGANLDIAAAIRVDGSAYLIMGNPQPAWNGGEPLATVRQLSVAVWATQTKFSFIAGSTVAVNLTFTSPMFATDWELLSRPAHYITMDVACADSEAHDVQLYFDVTARVVVRQGGNDVSWSRVAVPGVGSGPATQALRIGSTNQNPLADTDDQMNWGIVYLAPVVTSGSPTAASVLQYANTTRSVFFASGTLPSSDNPSSPSPLLPAGGTIPPTGPQRGIDRSGGDLPGYPITLNASDPNLCYALCNATQGCHAWAYAIPACDQYAQPTCWLKGNFPDTSNNKCRISGAQAQTSFGPNGIAAALSWDLGSVTAGTSRSVASVLAIDEVLSLNWFGEKCPPYWRRDLPVGDANVVPTDMLAAAHADYSSLRRRCDSFDAETSLELSAAGGDEYATIAQLTFRQVLGASALVWVPSKSAAWYFLKEISSCGCLNTADVVFPAFPQILYLSPELMRTMIVSHLEYATNRTNQPYPLPWAPHHLGYWPIADLPYTNQENMPLEETSWNLLILALIAQAQGGDVRWLEPYWSVIQTWYDFLITLLPFPQEQLSTDDFDGSLYNATNLAVKGVAAIAAYGYLLEKYTGNETAGAEAFATAASYAGTMVDFAWHNSGSDSHFLIGYRGSKGDGGDPTSWPMLYNLLFLRLLGYSDLLPNQTQLLATQEAWYAANKMQRYGLPLNSRKLYTKDDWQTFLASFYFDDSTPPVPSAFSTALLSGLYHFANETTSREALSDWTNTDSPTAVGFTARPVYGAMYAPLLVRAAARMGLGNATDPSVAHANAVFRQVHAQRAAAAAATAAAVTA